MDGQPILSEPQVIAVPSDRLWFDPAVILANCETRFYDYHFTAGLKQQILPGNARRIALGVAILAGLIGTQSYGPWPDVDRFTFSQMTPQAPVWLWLHQYLSVIPYPWYMYSSTVTDVRITEVTRL